MSAREHLTSLVSDKLEALDVTPSEELSGLEDGRRVRVGGVIVSRQRPPTAKGVAFLALEDEGGLTNVVIHPKVYEESRKALRSPFLMVQGRLQRRDEAINVVAQEIVALSVD
jgi:error-prone DNA polymerase